MQVVRNGLRGVAFGAGDGATLELRFMAVNADVQNGDVLVTSGIDGIYPPGLPVARSSTHRARRRLRVRADRLRSRSPAPTSTARCWCSRGSDRHAAPGREDSAARGTQERPAAKRPPRKGE